MSVINKILDFYINLTLGFYDFSKEITKNDDAFFTTLVAFSIAKSMIIGTLIYELSYHKINTPKNSIFVVIAVSIILNFVFIKKLKFLMLYSAFINKKSRKIFRYLSVLLVLISIFSPLIWAINKKIKGLI